MALLQLAENGQTNPLAKFIFIPAGMLGMQEDTYVREDFFDGLPDDQYLAVVQSLAPFQNTGLSGVVDTAVSFIPGVGPVAAQGVKVVTNLIQGRKDRVAAGTANPILKGGPKMGGNMITKIKAGIEKVKGKVPNTEKDLPVIDITGTVGGQTFDVQTGAAQQSTWEKIPMPVKVLGGVAAAAALGKALKLF